MSESSEVENLWNQLMSRAADHSQATHETYQALENAGLINRVVVHRYLCRKGHVLAEVIRVGSSTVARTRDYKLSPGMNLDRSVEAARARNTLDGDRHWPGDTFDVGDLATWGQQAGIDMNCRHALRTVLATDILAATRDVIPGHPGPPTRI